MKRNSMLSKVMCAALSGLMLFSLAACGTTDKGAGASGAGNSPNSKDPIVMVWYPNESAEDYAPAREEFGKLIEEATGRPVEQKLTTDYAIAIESIANGTASICFMGAQGYVEANAKSGDVKPLFVNSGASGTLDDALYYSFLSVKDEKKDQYMDGGEYSMEQIPGKRMSFVSNSSTSGFKVPTDSILEHFSKMPQWKGLDVDALIEGGPDKFFSEVLFGGSHQGSAVNLLTGKADIAAFCDTEINPYADLVEGNVQESGAVYRIKDHAAAPFDKYAGEKLAVIRSIPVLNGPFAYNATTLSPKEVEKIQKLFTSDEVANNETLFVTEESGKVGMFTKTDKERFVLVENEWYDPIRNLSK